MKRPDRWLALVGAALLVRYSFAGILALTQTVAHNGWYWSGNKDQVEYYATANALLHGAIAPIYTFMGYGTLLAPLVAGTDFVVQAIPRVVIAQLALAAPAALWLFRAGERLFDRRSAAIGTALWLTTPIWLTPIWFRSYSPAFNMAPFWIGLQISVDYATALLAVAVLALAAGGRDDGGIPRGLAVGVLSGLTVLAKPSNAVLVASAVVALAMWRRWHAAAATAIAAAVTTVPQLVLDWRLTGRPFHVRYWSAWPYGSSKPLTSIRYVPRTLGKLFLLNYTGPLLMLALIAALVLTWRRYPAARWLVVAQVVGYTLFFSPLYYSISEFMLRFMTTALPALCLACGAALGSLRRPRPVPVAARPLGRWTLAASGAALGGAVALAVFVGLAPRRPVLPVVASMRPTATPLARPSWVRIVWRGPDAPATLTYRVNRYELPRGRAKSVWVGVRTTIRDRPGRGRWRYLVLIEPGASPGGLPAGTKYVARSPAADVVVPR